MNKKTQFSLMILITLMLALTLAVPAQANKKTDFVVNYYEMVITDPEAGILEGSYTMYYDDLELGSGSAYVTRKYTGGEPQATMELQDDYSESSMVIQFVYHSIVNPEEPDPCDVFGTGSFVILATRGSGEYDLQGNGAFWACNVDNVFHGVLEGWATEFLQGD